MSITILSSKTKNNNPTFVDAGKFLAYELWRNRQTFGKTGPRKHKNTISSIKLKQHPDTFRNLSRHDIINNNNNFKKICNCAQAWDQFPGEFSPKNKSGRWRWRRRWGRLLQFITVNLCFKPVLPHRALLCSEKRRVWVINIYIFLYVCFSFTLLSSHAVYNPLIFVHI